jgi:hypothetical protein
VDVLNSRIIVNARPIISAGSVNPRGHQHASSGERGAELIIELGYVAHQTNPARISALVTLFVPQASHHPASWSGSISQVYEQPSLMQIAGQATNCTIQFIKYKTLFKTNSTQLKKIHPDIE